MTDVLAFLTQENDGKAPDWISLSYEELLRASGLTVEKSESFGSYQGDAIAVVSDGARRGIAIWGYGSCSGCDNLQDIEPSDPRGDFTEVNAYADEMRAGVIYPEKGETFQKMIARVLKNESNEWYIYDSEMKQYLLNLALED